MDGDGAILAMVGSTRCGTSRFLAAGLYAEGDLPRVILRDADPSSLYLADPLPVVAEALDAAVEEPEPRLVVPMDNALLVLTLAQYAGFLLVIGASVVRSAL
jgi:hypothetical protein